MSTGIITTIAGNLSPCCTSVGSYNGDGEIATLSTLSFPSDICFDKNGNLYIADKANYRVRKVDTFGVITTYAGNGTSGDGGDGGPAISAQFVGITGLAIDDTGNIYIADWDGGKIRKVNTSGIISTFAGTGSHTYSGDNIPAITANIGPVKIAFNNIGELFIADDPNNRIRMIDVSGIIHTVAGNGNCCYGGDIGPADSAELGQPGGIVLDACGNLYISQIDSPRIRKVSFNPSCLPLKVPETTTTQITIYPNPATSEIYIDNLKAESNYALFNVTGNIEQRGTLKKGNNSIAIQTIPTGIYLLELTDEEGKRTIKKIVKE